MPQQAHRCCSERPFKLHAGEHARERPPHAAALPSAPQPPVPPGAPQRLQPAAAPQPASHPQRCAAGLRPGVFAAPAEKIWCQSARLESGSHMSSAALWPCIQVAFHSSCGSLLDPGSTYTRGAICESLIHSRTWVTHCWPPDEAMACRPAGCACRQPEGPNSGPRQAVFTDKADGHHAWKDAAALRQAAFARTLAALHTHRQPDGSRDHVRRQGTDDQYTFRTRSQST